MQRAGNSFSKVPVDQTIEQTMNRHTETREGNIGFSTRPDAMQQWLVNTHQRAEITQNCWAMVGTSGTTSSADTTSSQRKEHKDEAANGG